MIDQYEGKNVVKLEDLDSYLGLEGNRGSYHGDYQKDGYHYMEEDPSGWEYNRVKNVDHWKQNS